MEFIFDGRGKAERTGHEKIAMRNIMKAIDWIVGGYFNDVQDENPVEYLPTSLEQLEEMIYSEAMNNYYADGIARSNGAPKEMRFAGEAFCRTYIHWKLSNDDCVEAIAEYAGWNKPSCDGSITAESEETMNNADLFLFNFGRLIKDGILVSNGESYLNKTDWVFGSDVWKHMNFTLSPEEMKILSTKPALIQRADCNLYVDGTGVKCGTDTLYRITKAGWERFNELETQMPKEEPKPDIETVKPMNIPDNHEKLQKILDYVPWCKADAIRSCWKDSDGYWIMLNEGWNADRMDTNCRTIHETTIYDLRYQIGGIRKVAE